jgi:hypothetical protein
MLLVSSSDTDVHRVNDLIRARCPELSEADLADAYGISTELESDLGASIWIELSERVLDAVEALEERLTRIEADLRQR